MTVDAAPEAMYICCERVVTLPLPGGRGRVARCPDPGDRAAINPNFSRPPVTGTLPTLTSANRTTRLRTMTGPSCMNSPGVPLSDTTGCDHGCQADVRPQTCPIFQTAPHQPYVELTRQSIFAITYEVRHIEYRGE
jgi:hypothetical protein